jgi:hypothetical protein
LLGVRIFFLFNFCRKNLTEIFKSESGEYKIISKLPDTMTTWIASGFSLNNKTGLAIASKIEVSLFNFDILFQLRIF